MDAQRLSFLIASTLVCLSSAAQAQGPWPTMNQPSFFSPVQEFFTPRSSTANYSQPMPHQNQYSQYQGTPIIPGVPQCANGRCRQSCPNGQCTTSNSCANGQCSIPSQTYYRPNGYASEALGTGNCANGTCRPSTSCRNGQCGPGNGSWNGSYGTSRLGLPNSTIGLRPLTPVNLNYGVNPNFNAQPRGGQVNRLVPLDGGFSVDRNSNAPQGPMYRDRESMIPQGQDLTYDPSIKLR